ncbi:MAG TPA: hypothetical protein VK943_04060 [Arenibaculum sp.]|nr:hypothetical protein [Arenibaculum sp.]
MQAPEPTLSPRDETFCHLVAHGATPASAAREAGYAPASAHRRGSEVYARDDIQRRIGLLTAERALAERNEREEFIRRFELLFEDCLKHGERSTALRALTVQLHLRGFDARSLTRRAEAERDRQAQADELRDRMHAELYAELYAEIRAEVLNEMERIGREVNGRKPPKQPHKPAGAERTMTNHDVCANPAGLVPEPVPALVPVPEPDMLGRALARIGHEARGNDDVLAGVLARAGFLGRRGRAARFEDATLPCLYGSAGTPVTAGGGLALGLGSKLSPGRSTVAV